MFLSVILAPMNKVLVLALCLIGANALADDNCYVRIDSTVQFAGMPDYQESALAASLMTYLTDAKNNLGYEALPEPTSAKDEIVEPATHEEAEIQAEADNANAITPSTVITETGTAHTDGHSGEYRLTLHFAQNTSTGHYDKTDEQGHSSGGLKKEDALYESLNEAFQKSWKSIPPCPFYKPAPVQTNN
jgi:hypothetical protein